LVDRLAGLHFHLANLLTRVHWYEAAGNAYGRAARLRPDDSCFQFQRAWCLLEVPHRRVESIAVFDSLLKTSPSSFGYYLMGCGLHKEQRHEEAVQAMDEARRLDPTASDRSYYCYDYGLCLASVGRFEEAADAFRDAALRKPSNAEAWGFLGLMFATVGRWTDAVPCLERAMRLSPCTLHGLHLGMTLHYLHRLDEAEQVLRECLASDPQSTTVKEALAQVLASQDRYEPALMLAQELCAMTPVEISSRAALAGVLSHAGRLDEALEEANAAVAACPSDPDAHAVLGSIYVDLNDGAAALAAFDRMERCREHRTERPAASLQVWCAVSRGNALSLLGRHEEAMCAFEEALRRDPEYFERWPEDGPHYRRSLRETQGGTASIP